MDSEATFCLQEPPFSESPLEGDSHGFKLCDLIKAKKMTSDGFSVYKDNKYPDFLYVRYRSNGKMSRRIPMMTRSSSPYYNPLADYIVMKPLDYDILPKDARKHELIRRFMYLNLLEKGSYSLYEQLLVKIRYDMTFSELLKVVIDCNLFEGTDLNARLEKVIKFVSTEVFGNSKLVEMAFERYISVSLFWLNLCFAGGGRIYIIDMEGELPDLTGVALLGQNIWWMLHLVSLPLQENYRTHIAPRIRCVDEMPYPSCFSCGESFAIDYWMMFTTDVKMFMACLDKYMVQLFGVKSIEDVPIFEPSTTYEESINRHRRFFVQTMVPPIAKSELYQHTIKELDIKPNTFFSFKAVLDMERWKNGPIK
ncbi:Hypothetical protein POVR1_LOCUS22 [uncultured virus]|nr:Hypothetical protein POVR1_LOCUS22 [uncultured virus]